MLECDDLSLGGAELEFNTTHYRTGSGSDWILGSTEVKPDIMFVECQHPVATAPGCVVSGDQSDFD